MSSEVWGRYRMLAWEQWKQQRLLWATERAREYRRQGRILVHVMGT